MQTNLGYELRPRCSCSLPCSSSLFIWLRQPCAASAFGLHNHLTGSACLPCRLESPNTSEPWQRSGIYRNFFRVSRSCYCQFPGRFLFVDDEVTSVAEGTRFNLRPSFTPPFAVHRRKYELASDRLTEPTKLAIRTIPGYSSVTPTLDCPSALLLTIYCCRPHDRPSLYTCCSFGRTDYILLLV